MIAPTFTLPLQLSQFVEDYFRREEHKRHNHWLLSTDPAIHTDNLSMILRQVDSMNTVPCTLCEWLACLLFVCLFVCLFVFPRSSPRLSQIPRGRA